MNPTDQARKLFEFLTFYLPNAFTYSCLKVTKVTVVTFFQSFMISRNCYFFLSSDMCLTCPQQFTFSLQEKKPGDVN